MNASEAAYPPLPLRHCYWVVPGLLLAGEHPDGATRDKTKDRLKKLLSAGIECFVDLTKPTELPRYDTLLPFYVEYKRNPIKDHGLPGSREQMTEILETVGNAMHAGRPVYVHCRAGIGRTGTVVGCFLVERGFAGDGALDELNRLWQQSKRSRTWAFVPETDAQASYVRDWQPVLKSGAFDLSESAAALSRMGPMSTGERPTRLGVGEPQASVGARAEGGAEPRPTGRDKGDRQALGGARDKGDRQAPVGAGRAAGRGRASVDGSDGADAGNARRGSNIAGSAYAGGGLRAAAEQARAAVESGKTAPPPRRAAGAGQTARGTLPPKERVGRAPERSGPGSPAASTAPNLPVQRTTTTLASASDDPYENESPLDVARRELAALEATLEMRESELPLRTGRALSSRQSPGESTSPPLSAAPESTSSEGASRGPSASEPAPRGSAAGELAPRDSTSTDTPSATPALENPREPISRHPAAELARRELESLQRATEQARRDLDSLRSAAELGFGAPPAREPSLSESPSPNPVTPAPTTPRRPWARVEPGAASPAPVLPPTSAPTPPARSSGLSGDEPAPLTPGYGSSTSGPTPPARSSGLWADEPALPTRGYAPSTSGPTPLTHGPRLSGNEPTPPHPSIGQSGNEPAFPSRGYGPSTSELTPLAHGPRLSGNEPTPPGRSIGQSGNEPALPTRGYGPSTSELTPLAPGPGLSGNEPALPTRGYGPSTSELAPLAPGPGLSGNEPAPSGRSTGLSGNEPTPRARNSGPPGAALMPPTRDFGSSSAAPPARGFVSRGATPGTRDAAPSPSDADPLLDPETLIAARAMRERFVGAFLGLAVGDAVAAATQYRRPGTFTPVGDMLGGGPFDLPRGAWSDDTAMALCLADSLLQRNGFDGRDQVQRYTRWQQEGYLSSTGLCIGITASTARSLAVAQWRRVVFPGSHDPEQLDPEPLSRIAPIALYYVHSLEETQQQAADSSRATCQAGPVLEACRLLGRALHAALSSQSKARILAEAGGAPAGPPETNNSAAGALASALWAFHSTDNFRDAVLQAANVGGNSDVVASVCGQLAGAHYGFSAIPPSWRNGLMQKELIESYADQLLAHALVTLSK